MYMFVSTRFLGCLLVLAGVDTLSILPRFFALVPGFAKEGATRELDSEEIRCFVFR